MGSWNRTEKVSKYSLDNEMQVSYYQRNRFQVGKGEKRAEWELCCWTGVRGFSVIWTNVCYVYTNTHTQEREITWIQIFVHTWVGAHTCLLRRPNRKSWSRTVAKITPDELGASCIVRKQASPPKTRWVCPEHTEANPKALLMAKARTVWATKLGQYG